MRKKRFDLFCILMLGISSGHGQKLDSYIGDMKEALVPYEAITYAPSCHNVLIELKGPWANFAIPDGTNPNSPSEMTWTVLKLDVIRVYLDLADLDEDKIQNHAIFSLDYISKHRRGTPYVPDTPAVMLFAKGLNTEITVNAVDLDKVDALRGQAHITEGQMGLFVDGRKFVALPFADQQHADVFAKAIQKAVVLCKAQ